ncbi:hypothetical protein PoB_000111200 [Plakobranchus ocellatus]|uniref:Uncharacterized protein n=1 Tax=Plakobranchus ocellatus TaxID=259542 RepID=A0AAV3XWT7_9GAST|nr:hypothetical protein PoB_000111200 [Plakobranchus ocellatus]
MDTKRIQRQAESEKHEISKMFSKNLKPGKLSSLRLPLVMVHDAFQQLLQCSGIGGTADRKPALRSAKGSSLANGSLVRWRA